MLACMAFAPAGVDHSSAYPMEGLYTRGGSMSAIAQAGFVLQQHMHTLLVTLSWLDCMYDHHHHQQQQQQQQQSLKRALHAGKHAAVSGGGFWDNTPESGEGHVAWRGQAVCAKRSAAVDSYACCAECVCQLG
jgi:hypothetical protein